MKKVYQKIVCPHRGDCTSAAIGSILGIDDVPPFVAIAYDNGKPHDWHTHMLEWLRERGYHSLDISFNDLHDWRGLVGALCIASVPSQKYATCRHAVVGSWIKRDDGGHQFTIVHDPRPDNAPYPAGTEPSYVAFLVKIDPSNNSI